MKKAYLTKDRYEEIAEELKQLKTEGRRAVAERLKQAKDLGDLSENFDYQTAREEQSKLEQRINQLEDLLRTSSIIAKTPSGGVVRVGARVVVDRAGTSMTFTITGSSEARPGDGLISNESPIGKALLGRKAGDEVAVMTPRGEARYRIVSVE